MDKTHRKVSVTQYPKCNFCGGEAHYDGKTRFGAWGHMCLQCFGVNGIGLGLGRGQELVLENNNLAKATGAKAPGGTK